MACHILDSIPDMLTYQTFTERYFTKRYAVNVGGIQNNDIMMMFHSNRIALLSLAPSHFFFKNDKAYKINFAAGNVDRLCNAVKGKGKKGGQRLHPQSIICKIEYEDGTDFNILSCMKGNLVEVNEQLVSQPRLLRDYPDSKGYIVVILSSIENSDATKNGLLTHEEYMLNVKGSE